MDATEMLWHVADHRGWRSCHRTREAATRKAGAVAQETFRPAKYWHRDMPIEQWRVLPPANGVSKEAAL